MPHVTLRFSVTNARKLKEALDVVSGHDHTGAINSLREMIKYQIDYNDETAAPWRAVVDRTRSKIARTRNGNSVYQLRLECGHSTRETDGNAPYVRRKRCQQCADDRQTQPQPERNNE